MSENEKNNIWNKKPELNELVQLTLGELTNVRNNIFTALWMYLRPKLAFLFEEAQEARQIVREGNLGTLNVGPFKVARRFSDWSGDVLIYLINGEKKTLVFRRGKTDDWIFGTWPEKIGELYDEAQAIKKAREDLAANVEKHKIIAELLRSEIPTDE